MVSDGHDTPVVVFRTVKEMAVSMYIPSVCCHMCRSFIIAVLPLQLLQLGYQEAEVGSLISLSSFAGFLIILPAGKLSTAYGPRALIVVGNVLLCGGALLFLVAKNMVLLCFGVALLGMGDSSVLLARSTYLTVVVPPEERGNAMSANGGMRRFAYAAGPLVSGLLAHHFGVESSYSVELALGALALILTLGFLPYVACDQDLSRAQSHREPTARLGICSVFWNHRRVFISLAGLTMSLAFMRKAREMFFPLEGFAIHLSQEAVGCITAFSFALDFLFFPLGGWLLDTVGRVPTGALCCLGFALAMTSLSFPGLLPFTVFALGTGVANGMSSGIFQVIVADRAPSSCRGLFIAVFRNVNQLGEMAAPALVAVVAGSTSLCVSALISGAVGVFGCVWVLLFVPETRPRALLPETHLLIGGEASEEGCQTLR